MLNSSLLTEEGGEAFHLQTILILNGTFKVTSLCLALCSFQYGGKKVSFFFVAQQLKERVTSFLLFALLNFQLNKENKTLKRISMLYMAKLGPEIITEEINIDEDDPSTDTEANSGSCNSVHCQQQIKGKHCCWAYNTIAKVV